MAIGDKMVLTLSGGISALDPSINVMQNVFAYEVVSGTGDTDDLVTSFISTVLPDIRDITSTLMQWRNVSAYNLDNDTDFASEDISLLGNRSGPAAPYFVGFAYRYGSTVRGVNDGRKTFGVIRQADIEGGVAVGDIVTFLDALEPTLNNQIVGATASYAPRLWRRAGSYAPYSGDPPVGTPYPDTFYPISGVDYIRVSSQNTRKR